MSMSMSMRNVVCRNGELRIALDVESVLADTHPYFIEMYNDKFGSEYKVCDIDDWDWVREEVEWEDFDGIVNDGWKYRADEIAVREENISETVCELENLTENTIVDIVTARTGVESEMQNWLTHNEITNYNDFIATTQKKSELGYHVYIDDNPNMPNRISENQLQILIRGTHNRGVEEQDNVIAEYTVSDAVNTMNEVIETC